MNHKLVLNIMNLRIILWLITFCACQGQAFFFGVVCQFVDYKKLSFLITYMYGICLPVDTLIFYKGVSSQYLQTMRISWIIPNWNKRKTLKSCNLSDWWATDEQLMSNWWTTDEQLMNDWWATDEWLINDDLLMIRGFWWWTDVRTHPRTDGQCWLLSRYRDWKFCQEPFGMIGTMFAMVWGYLPFVSLVADASFPDELDTWFSE